MIPEISIIVTNYNYSRYLERCLRSCLNQRDVDFEVILVDDCSTDNVSEVVKPFLCDITYLRNKENLGVAETSNIGIRASRGRFFIRVDADDYINEEACYFLRRVLADNKNAFGVACDYIHVDKHEEKLQRFSAKENPISCGVLYRKDLFLQQGGYNSEFRYKEHEEFLKRLDGFYEIFYLPIPFYRYRRHGENKTLHEEYKKVEV
jgi:glycosyltransferase involved in cell wall biosynthesis